MSPVILSESMEGPMPCPYTVKPSAAMLQAKALCQIPENFRGRVGCLIEQVEGKLRAYYRYESYEDAVSRYELLTEDALWPTLTLSEIPDRELVNGWGMRAHLVDIVRGLLETYPVKPLEAGGREIEWRKGQLCCAVRESLRSPAIALLIEFNAASRRRGRLAGLFEWWVGETPLFEIRFSGTCYAPRASSRYLYDWLIQGHEVEKTKPFITHDAIEIPVLFEDEVLIAVNKPGHLSSVSGKREHISCQSILEKTRGELFVVHRLDQATSGILFFAKTRQAERLMQEAFRGREVKKRYEAVLSGRVKQRTGEISLALSVNRLDRPRQCPLPEQAGGKHSVTRYAVKASLHDGRGNCYTWVDLWPQTGRTHQLRIHCGHFLGLNAPIVGDSFYGKEGLMAEDPDVALRLHAAEIQICHPLTHQVIHLVCPPDWGDFFQRVRLCGDGQDER